MLDTATLTGIFYGTDGTPVTEADVYVVPNQKYLASVGGAAWVPRSVSFRTDASGAIGTLDGEIFTPGIALGIGQHDIAVRKAGQSWSGVLTVDAAMAASATPTTLDAALQPAPPPELVSRADLAVGMAETAADEAAASAAAALAYVRVTPEEEAAFASGPGITILARAPYTGPETADAVYAALFDDPEAVALYDQVYDRSPVSLPDGETYTPPARFGVMS
ncbi:MAG: hypothetical protein H5U16_03430 [Roseovarius sp.]|nr:hypothetical protein [Roseovarius sp.]